MSTLGSVATSAELQQRLGVSQPTVSRMLRPLLAAGRVLAVGAARAQRYLLPRPVAGVGTRVPVAEIDAHGQPHPFGTLVPLVGGGYWMQEHHGLSARHPGLPWFLQDMRPQGFLGRTFAQTHPELELPPHIDHWSDEHSLKALVHLGDDQPGNLVVGEPALARYLSRQSLGSAITDTTITDPDTDYPRLARQAIESVLPGSVRARVAIEAGCAMSWYKYIGLDGETVTVDHFGASAPAGVLFKEFGFTVENVVAAAERAMSK